MQRTAIHVALLLAFLAAISFTIGACGGGGGSGGDGGIITPPDDNHETPGMTHASILLRDRLGNPIAEGSTEPMSPRRTCGQCHNSEHPDIGDIDVIAGAYHFQQGRVDENGAVAMKADFFGDGRDFLLSPGMYGKW